MSYSNDTDTQTSKVIHINSLDNNTQFSSGFTTDFNYEITDSLICPENQKMLVSCIGATIPYTFYNIRTGVNDKVRFQVNSSSTSYEVFLDAGNYNTSSFATEFNTKVNTGLTASAGTTLTISLSYDFQKMKYKVSYPTTDGGNTHILLDFSTGKNCAVEVGGDSNAVPTAFLEASFLPNVADLNGSIHGLYIRTDLMSNAVYDSESKSLSHILARIPIRVNFGGVIFYESFEGVNHKIELDSQHINRIRIRLTDERNRLINLNGLNFTLSLLFDFVYKKQQKPTLNKFSRRIQENSLPPKEVEKEEKRGRPRKVGRPKKEN